jgi:hypothetical protein
MTAKDTTPREPSCLQPRTHKRRPLAVHDTRTTRIARVARSLAACSFVDGLPSWATWLLSKAADKAIRSHPYQTVGITFGLAFGLGLAIGLLARRK